MIPQFTFSQDYLVFISNCVSISRCIMWKNREPIISFIGPMCKAKLYIEFSRYIDFISG